MKQIQSNKQAKNPQSLIQIWRFEHLGFEFI
jgi:hypothetical protein